MSGFGHRVYKNYDPRAKVIRKLADEVFSIVGRDPLIEVSFPIRFDHRQEFFFSEFNLFELLVLWFELSGNV
jgi:citrate synthase